MLIWIDAAPCGKTEHCMHSIIIVIVTNRCVWNVLNGLVQLQVSHSSMIYLERSHCILLLRKPPSAHFAHNVDAIAPGAAVILLIIHSSSSLLLTALKSRPVRTVAEIRTSVSGALGWTTVSSVSTGSRRQVATPPADVNIDCIRHATASFSGSVSCALINESGVASACGHN